MTRITRTITLLAASLSIAGTAFASQDSGSTSFAGEQQALPWTLLGPGRGSSQDAPVLRAADLEGDGIDEVLAAGGTGFLGRITVLPGDRLVFDEHPVAGTLRDVVAEDLDGDGRLDALVASSAGLAVLSNDGSGQLLPATFHGTEPLREVRAADLDGDGTTDLVGLREAGGLLSWLGDGAGGFTATTAFYPGGVRNLVVGDWDEDGLADAALVEWPSKILGLLRGDGQGGFTKLGTQSGTHGIRDVEVADFDGDGHLDIARLITHNVDRILYGDGTGQFVKGPFLSNAYPALAYSSRDLDTGDLNGDGLADLLIVEAGSYALLSHPSRQPARFWSLPTGRSSRGVTGRFDNDEHLDTLALSLYAPSVTLHHGNGSGQVRQIWKPEPTPTAQLQLGVGLGAAGDLNGDGAPDLVRVVSGFGLAEVFLAGSGSFDFVGSYGLGGTPHSADLVDVNVDGDLDLVLVRTGPGNLAVLLGDGAGGFGPILSSPLGLPAPLTTVAIVDMDGDALPDLVGAQFDNGLQLPSLLTVHPGDGLGRFGPAAALLPIGYVEHIDTGDVDGDGDSDLLLVEAWGTSPVNEPHGPRVLLGDGQGGLAAQVPIVLPMESLLASEARLVDLDGDGRLDVAMAAVSSSGNGVAVARSTGPGSFAPAKLEVRLPAAFPEGMLAGDLDGDGDEDLVVGLWQRGAQVLRGLGDGGLEPWATVGASTLLAGTGDVDRDGRADLLFVDAAMIRVGR